VYTLGRDGVFHAATLQVLTLTEAGISAVLSFHRPDLFGVFGLPIDRVSERPAPGPAYD
jgi:RNA polymerase sigma-70 factor (ECF subfamily)